MAISVVHTTAANTLTVTIPATTAGNCLIVCIASFNASTVTGTVSGITLGGSAGNFAQAVAGHGSNGFTAASDAIIWCDPNCAGGQTSVAISGSNLNVASGNGGVVVYEVSGLVLSAVVDKTMNGGAGTGTAWSSGATATTTQASEFWVGVADVVSPTGPGAPWANTSAGTGCIAGQQIASSTGTATYSGTQTNTSWAAVVATLKGVGNVSVALPVAQETIAAPAPAPGAGPLALPVAQVTEAAPPPTPVINVSVALTTAQETIAALAPTPQMSGVSLPVAQVTEAAPPPTPVIGVVVNLPAAQVTVSAPAPSLGGSVVALGLAAVTVAAPAPGLSLGKNVNLTVAAEAVAARPPTPSVNISLALTTARVTVSANPPKASRQLLISLASRSGTDDYGTTFPQGILATAGVIEGPTLIGSDAFFYDGTPAFGNLVQSITEADGTDQFGNAYIAGTTTYNSVSFWSAVQISGGAVTWYTASGPGGPWTIQAAIGFSFNALTGGNLVLQGTNGTLQMPNGGTIPQSLSGSIQTLPTDNNSGSSWVSGERSFMNNNWVTPINNNFAAIVAALDAAGITI